MSLPITAKVQQMTQGGLKTTQPILGDKPCGCKQPCSCGSSPATKKSCGYKK